MIAYQNDPPTGATPSVYTLPATYTPWPTRCDSPLESGPRFFGGLHPLFGWYHAPSGRIRHEVVVLCASIGPEYATAHRALRTLAEQLAADGFAVLRFDWPGTGDSAGDVGDPACASASLDAWRAALVQAVACARAWSGHARASIVALRGAAFIAADVAPSLGLARLVLWWPPTSGRQFLRELRARHAMADYEDDRYAPPHGDVALADGAMESDGFVLAPAFVQAFRQMTFASMGDGSPAEDVLVVAPDQGAEPSVAGALAARGTSVAVRRAPGHEAMRLTALWTTLPAGAIDTIAAWMLDRAGAAAGAIARVAPPSRTPNVSATLAGSDPTRVAAAFADAARADAALAGVTAATFDGVREECVRFGTDGRVMGVLTRPVGPHGATDPPPVLLLQTGGDHRIGPNRLWPVWARRWARDGVATLRFDPAGVGDTEGETVDRAARYDPYGATRVDEVAEAAEFLCERTGARSVVLVGICSGAYHAARAAASGVPVARVIAINPQFYEGFEALDRGAVEGHYAPALLGKAASDPQRWGRLLRGETSARLVAEMVAARAGNVVRAAVTMAAQEARAITRLGSVPSSGPLADLWRAAEMGVPLSLVFAKEDEGWAYLRVQAREAWRAFHRRHAVPVHVLDRTQHTFVRAWMQRLLYDVVSAERRGTER